MVICLHVIIAKALNADQSHPLYSSDVGINFDQSIYNYCIIEFLNARIALFGAKLQSCSNSAGDMTENPASGETNA